MGAVSTPVRIKKQMSKAERGTKRVCPNCGARFYDLNKDPAICPSCQTACRVDQPPVPAPRRGAAVERAAPAPVPKEVKRPAAKAVEPETISLEEAEGTETSGDETDAVEEIVDIDDEDTDAATDNDTFLEEEEDADPDVKGILK